MSVIVPVVERADDVVAVYRAFAEELNARRQPYEFLFVFDGRLTPPPDLVALSRDNKNVRILRFAREFGETAALRLALSALKSAAIDARGDLADAEAVAVLQREARKRREAEQVYRDAGRATQADQEAYERSVLERFLPAALDPDELAHLVDQAVAASGASGPKELGKVMGRLMPQVKGRADGNEVRRLVLERLGG